MQPTSDEWLSMEYRGVFGGGRQSAGPLFFHFHVCPLRPLGLGFERSGFQIRSVVYSVISGKEPVFYCVGLDMLNVHGGPVHLHALPWAVHARKETVRASRQPEKLQRRDDGGWIAMFQKAAEMETVVRWGSRRRESIPQVASHDGLSTTTGRRSFLLGLLL